MRAQTSLEAIFIVGFSTALLVPASMLFYQFLVSTSEGIKENNVKRIGNSFVENANLMYQYGSNAKIIIEHQFPDFVTNMSIVNNDTLIIEYESHSGKQTPAFFFGHNVKANFTKGDWQQGIRSFEFKTVSRGDAVLIQKV